MDFYNRINNIEGADKEAISETQKAFDKIAKPLNGLGLLEKVVSCISGIDKNLDIKKRCVIVACSDNGIVEEGVTQTSSDVTAIVAGNILKGDATVCNMAVVANAEIIPVDVGMNVEVEGLLTVKSRRGTNNFAREAAMSENEAKFAIESGMNHVKVLKEKGYKMIAVGEMGIGNTTTASAICKVLTGKTAEEVTSKGAGLSLEGLKKKISVIENAVKKMKPIKEDVIDILSKVGGFDIAYMCGIFLGGAESKVITVIDGFISSVAANLAVILNKNALDYMISSHLSNESGGKIMLERLGKTPIICGQMALGEGTGAVAIMPLLDMAIAVLKNMKTFEEINIEEYKKL